MSNTQYGRTRQFRFDDADVNALARSVMTELQFCTTWMRDHQDQVTDEQRAFVRTLRSLLERLSD